VKGRLLKMSDARENILDPKTASDLWARTTCWFPPKKKEKTKVVKTRCQICGAKGKVFGFIKLTRNGMVKFEACMKCIERLT